jgi:rhodanese-related sulfurtransferase/DNA-binding transcriptional ArsR family regulator
MRLMADRDAKTALYEQFARVGKALASGKRLELLDLLAQGERSVDVLARTAGLGLTTASAHLQTLRQAGLVTTRRDGTRIHYSLAGDDVASLYAMLRSVAHDHITDVEAARIAYLGLAGPPRGVPAQSAGEPVEPVEEVDRQGLLDRVRSGELVVLDVRPAEEYRSGHVPGAVGIPLGELADRLAELPPDAQVVAYCRGAYCVLAHDAVRILRARGRRAARLADGMLEWRLAGLPVDSGAP